MKSAQEWSDIIGTFPVKGLETSQTEWFPKVSPQQILEIQNDAIEGVLEGFYKSIGLTDEETLRQWTSVYNDLMAQIHPSIK